MYIRDILDDFDDVIIERGKAYFHEGRVKDLTKTSAREYSATVEGTEDYFVNVAWDEDGECSFDCDCPYSGAPYCKHVVAVLLAIEAGEAGESDESDVPRESLKDMLKKLSQTELADILYSLTEQFPMTESWLRAHLSPPQNALAEYRNLIRKTADEYSYRGYIQYGDMSDALAGVSDAVEYLQSMKNCPDIGQILDFLRMVLEETTSIGESGDDSEGFTGDYIGDCIAFLNDLWTQRILPADVAEKTAYFEKVLQMLDLPVFRIWDESGDVLLEQCIQIADSVPCLRERILQNQMKWAEKTENNYSAKCAQMNCYDMLLRWQGEAAAMAFVEQHPENDDFRVIVLERYIREKQYEEAIRFCLEAERENDSYPGLRRTWQERRCKLYAQIGDVKNEKQLSETLLLEGKIEYYSVLKKLYAAEQWSAKRIDLLNRMEKKEPYIYLDIILREQDTPRIMAYLRKHPHDVFELYKYVLDDYSDEIEKIFLSVLEEAAANAGDRKAYHDVCQHVRIFHDVFANTAKDFIHTLQETYRRRPAFQDEIKKILPYCAK